MSWFERGEIGEVDPVPGSDEYVFRLDITVGYLPQTRIISDERTKGRNLITFLSRAFLTAVRSWKAIHFFSIELRKGRVLPSVHKLVSTKESESRLRNSIVKIASDPRTKYIPRALRLETPLIR